MGVHVQVCHLADINLRGNALAWGLHNWICLCLLNMTYVIFGIWCDFVIICEFERLTLLLTFGRLCISAWGNI